MFAILMQVGLHCSHRGLVCNLQWTPVSVAPGKRLAYKIITFRSVQPSLRDSEIAVS